MGVTQSALMILNWRKFLLYVWLPHFFAQWGIVSMNMLQHDGCDVNVDLDSRSCHSPVTTPVPHTHSLPLPQSHFQSECA